MSLLVPIPGAGEVAGYPPGTAEGVAQFLEEPWVTAALKTMGGGGATPER